MIKQLTLLLILLSFSVKAITITEVMYNPPGTDNDKEYVELYTQGIRLDNYIIEDLATTDVLQLKILKNSSYALIVEDGFNYTNINATIYTIGKTIGNGLNNNKDLILIRDNTSKIIDALLYTNNQGGNGNNQSLCRQNNNIYECLPSPGTASKGQQFTNSSHQLSINEFLPDPEGNDKAPLPDGEWVELYNQGQTSIDLKGFKLYDKTNRSITITDVNFAKNSIIKANEYKVIYLNVQLLLNNQGPELVGLQLAGNILDEVQYEGTREGISWSKHQKGYYQLSKPTPGEENNLAEEALQTNISIEKVYLGNDGIVKFGEQLRVRLQIYKGDITKNMVKAYVVNLTKQTRFNLHTKLQDYVITIPLQLEPNCKNKHKEGVYKLIVDGLDVVRTTNITVKGINQQNCITIKENKTVKSVIEKQVVLKTTENSQKSEIFDPFVEKQGKLVYESNDAKAQRYALYFFCLMMIMIVGAYIFGINT